MYIARIGQAILELLSFNNKTNDPILSLTPENITQYSKIE